MIERDFWMGAALSAPPRRRFLAAAAGLGAGAALAGLWPGRPVEVAASAAAACGESVLDIINAALVAEQIAVTFYHAGLTAHPIVSNAKIAGASGDPNAVAADGNPVNVAFLQAALYQEQQHWQALAGAGATSPYRGFYFPNGSFEELGFTNRAGTYLWVLDHLETAFIGAYLAAARRFGALGRVDLAVVALRILGVECEHRALYRVISDDDPADNVTLEVAQYDCVGDAVGVLEPFLSGRGFSGGATPHVAIPTPAQVRSAVGNNATA